MEEMTVVVDDTEDAGPKGPVRRASHYEARAGGRESSGSLAMGSTMCLAGMGSLTLSLRGSPRRER